MRAILGNSEYTYVIVNLHFLTKYYVIMDEAHK